MTNIFEVQGLSTYEKLVYLVVTQTKTKLTYDEIAEAGSMCRRKAIYAVAVLVERGLIEKSVQPAQVTKNRTYIQAPNTYDVPAEPAAVDKPSAQDAPPAPCHAPHAPLKSLDLKTLKPKHINHRDAPMRAIRQMAYELSDRYFGVSKDGDLDSQYTQQLFLEWCEGRENTGDRLTWVRIKRNLEDLISDYITDFAGMQKKLSSAIANNWRCMRGLQEKNRHPRGIAAH